MSIKEEMDFGGLVPRNYSLHLRMILELQKFQFQVLFSMSFRFYVGLLLLYASSIMCTKLAKTSCFVHWLKLSDLTIAKTKVYPSSR